MDFIQHNTLIASWKCFNNSILNVLSSALAYVFQLAFAVQSE